MHTLAHQQQLAQAAAVGVPGSEDRIRAINTVIERMERENPGAFRADALAQNVTRGPDGRFCKAE